MVVRDNMAGRNGAWGLSVPLPLLDKVESVGALGRCSVVLELWAEGCVLVAN